MVQRIVPERCCGVLIDVQSFFLAQVEKRQRARIVANTANLLRLLNYFEIPVAATVEQPVERKGMLPPAIARYLGEQPAIFEKLTFDLCKEPQVRAHLKRLNKKQMIVAGCETDVCVMQSCLGLLELGYEVYLVEETLFSSSRNVAAALARMTAAGAVIVTYKMLFYELMESVDGRRTREKGRTIFRPFPDDLPDAAV